MHLAVAVGTRPEALKLGPLIQYLRQQTRLRLSVFDTGQQPDLIRQALRDAHLNVTHRFVVPRSWSLARRFAHLARRCAEYYEAHAPHAVMILGDTASSLAAAEAAYFSRIPVLHIEAGLRSPQAHDPFPEETNRRLISRVASYHFAIDTHSARNLVTEGFQSGNIRVVGNLAEDALAEALRELPNLRRPSGRKTLLLTLHRTENVSDGGRRVRTAIENLVRVKHDLDVTVVCHPNPILRTAFCKSLRLQERVQVVSPMSHREFVAALGQAAIVATDSAGVSEEAVLLGIPLCILRNVTERPDTLRRGAVLAGNAPDDVTTTILRLLAKGRSSQRRRPEPFRVAQQVTSAITELLI